MKIAAKPLPHGKQTVTPYIIVKGAPRFIDFLKEAFDAHEFGRAENSDGTIGHAGVQLGNSTLMIADGKEQWRDTPCFLSVYVDDADEVFEQALKAGATQVTEMTTFNILGDRTGRVGYPFGNIWWIQTHLRDVSPEETLKLLKIPKRWQSCRKCRKRFSKKWTSICCSGTGITSTATMFHTRCLESFANSGGSF